jgi:hypothetical protein
MTNPTLFCIHDSTGKIYENDSIIPFNGFPQDTFLRIVPHPLIRKQAPMPTSKPSGITVSVKSDFCSKEFVFEMVSPLHTVDRICQFYLDVMAVYDSHLKEMVDDDSVSDVHFLDVRFDGSDQLIDIQSTFRSLDISVTCTLILSKK